MANKTLDLTLKVSPSIDAGKEAKLNKLLQQLGSKMSLDIELDDKAIGELEDAFNTLSEHLADPIAPNIDTDAAMSALEQLSKGIDAVGNFDAIDTKELSKAFDTAKQHLSAYLAEAEKARDELKASGGEGTDAYKKISTEIEHAKQQLEGFNGESGNTKGSFLEQFTKFQAVGELGAKLGELAERGNAVRESLKQVQAQTGSSAEEMAALKDNAEEAFVHGIGENLAESIKIAGTAQTVFKGILPPDQIKEFTQGAAAIGKAFDVDVNEVLKGSRSFVESFGLSAQEATGLIANLMQSSRGTEILPILEEFSPLVKKAGFSAQEFAGVLEKGFESGVRNGEKLADSIKEAQIRLSAGDISTGLVAIQSPITKTIQGIVALGESGQKSVKDVLTESAGTIKQAFDSGEISSQVRDQLTVALSGSMAEEVGGAMWSNIFGSKIDTSAIDAAAQKSAEEVKRAIEPVSLTAKFSKELELFQDKAAALVAPIASNMAGALQGISSIAPGLSLVTDNFGNIKSVALKLIPVIGTMWTVLTGPVGLIIAGLVAIGAALYYFFTQTAAGKEAFEAITSYISAFVDNAGELLDAFIDYAKAILNPANWFDGDAISKASAKMGAAISKMVNDGANNVKKSKLSTALEEAVQLKGDLDKNGKLKELVEKFKAAKTDAEKNSLAALIQEQVPGAVDGMRQVVDSQGKLTTAFDINIDKAQEFADAQDKAVGDQLSSKVGDFRNGIVVLGEEYDNNRKKLAALGDQIVQTAKQGGDVSELKQQYKETADAVDSSADALGKAVAQGQKLGLAGKDVAGELGLAGDKAAVIAAAISAGEKKLKDAAKSVVNLSKAFEDAKKQSDALTQNLQGQLQGLVYARQQGKLSAEEYAAQHKQLTQQYTDARRAQENLAQIESNTTASVVARTELVTKELDRKKAEIDLAREQSDIDREIVLMREKREALVVDEIAKQQELIGSMEATKRATEEAAKRTPDIAQARELRGQVKELNAQILVENKNLNKLEVQAKLEREQLDREVATAKADLKRKRIEFDISLGLADESELLPLIHKQLEAATDEVAYFQARANNTQGALQDQYLLKVTEAKGRELDIKKSLFDTQSALAQREYDKEQALRDIRFADIQRDADREQAVWEALFATIAEASANVFDTLEQQAMDSLDAEQQAALDRIAGVTKTMSQEEAAKLAVAEEYEQKKAELQEKYRLARLAKDAELAGLQAAQQSEQDVRSLRMQQEQLQAQLELAQKTGNALEALKLSQSLESIGKDLSTKGDVILTLSGKFQEGISSTFANLLEGSDDAAKDSMRKTLGTIAGFLEKLLDAAIIEIVLGSEPLKLLAGTFGLFAPLALAGFSAAVGAGVHAIVSPILSSILSFPTGGRFDTPQYVQIGDGGRLGGLNREWLFRDDQLRMVLAEAVTGVQARLEQRLTSLEQAYTGTRVVGVLRGRDIYLVNQREHTAEHSRQVRIAKN